MSRASVEQCSTYGRMVAERFKDLPNIVWMSGGDYFPRAENPARGSHVDHCIDAMVRGIRATGDNRPFSIQLWYNKSLSTESPYWSRRVDWNFVYTYFPTYRAVLQAYEYSPTMPAVLGEANYETENNQPDTPPTTDLTLRRQLMWALTSGASGDFVGGHDWGFDPGWQQRLSTPAVTQISRLRDWFSSLDWWRLVPDTDGRLVTAGRGTPITTDDPIDVLENDYVTAARTEDGRLAVVYLPAEHTISVDTSVTAPGTTARWIDPTTGRERPVPMSPTFTTPGPNAAGDPDWILMFSMDR